MTPPRTLLAWAAACLVLSPAAFADWQAGIDAYRARDFEQAVAEFRQFVDERPDQHAGHLMLGRSLFAAERYKAAAAALRLAEDFEALVEAIRRGGPPKWLPGDPVRGSDGARTG
ncbi:MAG: tetratricopeptide repeat protein [Acidobacteria bacterium]|nr:tetratricopeptide repeat protein [Acidobacteriota bacterium]MXZ36816.1 tetratricopeptide repeat protein [Holophagales bacterium]MYF03717.1 tetratricopeptide repeat protein [Holophagales bacterium]MYJ25489.1 tetratricopeptide repeat protein [Holophagales bacterium]